ncbi:hypothetical protein P9112_008768 [Eukaryota sp. TZLM1-RC]
MSVVVDFLHNVLIYRGTISPILLFDLKNRYTGDEGYALDSTVSLLGATAMSLSETLGSGLSTLAYRNTMLIFESFNDITYIVQCSSSTNEVLLRKAISLAHKLLCLKFGPVFLNKSRVSFKKHSVTVSCFITVAIELIFSDISHLLDATPAPILDQTIKNDLEQTLRKSCSTLGNVAFHSLLFVGTQPIASILRSSVRRPPREFASFVYTMTRLKLINQQPLSPSASGVLVEFSDLYISVDSGFEQYGVAIFPLSLSTEKPVVMVLLFNALEREIVDQRASQCFSEAKKHLDLLICLALTIDKRSHCLSCSYPGLCSFVVVNRLSDGKIATLHQGCASFNSDNEVVLAKGNQIISKLRHRMIRWVVTCHEALGQNDTCLLIDRGNRFTFAFRLWLWVHSSGCILDVPLPEKKQPNDGEIYECLLNRLKYRNVNICEVYAVFLSPLATDEVLLSLEGLREFVQTNYYMNSK